MRKASFLDAIDTLNRGGEIESDFLGQKSEYKDRHKLVDVRGNTALNEEILYADWYVVKEGTPAMECENGVCRFNGGAESYE